MKIYFCRKKNPAEYCAAENMEDGMLYDVGRSGNNNPVQRMRRTQQSKRGKMEC